MDLFDDDLEHEVLIDLLRCVTSISQQLGKTASSIFYESFVSTPVISSEEVVPRILKFLETGCSSSVATLKLSELGTNVAWEKKLMDHKSLRKFSVDMLLSLHALCRKAVTWSKVLSVIESYLKFLVPQKIVQNLDAEPLLDINASILVQATSQVAKMMFESALDILLFVSYLVSNSGQVGFFFLINFIFLLIDSCGVFLFEQQKISVNKITYWNIFKSFCMFFYFYMCSIILLVIPNNSCFPLSVEEQILIFFSLSVCLNYFLSTWPLF